MKPQDLIKSDIKLFSLPTIVSELNLLVATGSAREIGHLVSQDAGLTARLLRIANSGFYGLPHKIDNMQQAVSIVGIRELVNLVMATVAVSRFASIQQNLVDMETFWQRSIFMAVAASTLADEIHNKERGWLFVSGLLHDIGSLILYTKLPEQSQTVLKQADGNRSKISELEIATFGFSAAELGAALATEWKMSDTVRLCLEKQLLPLNDPLHDPQTRLMRAARIITDMLSDGSSSEACAVAIESEGPQVLQIDTDRLMALIEDLPEQATNLYGNMIA